jgi:hypothetical protein
MSRCLKFRGAYGIPSGYLSPGRFGIMGGGRLYLLNGGAGRTFPLMDLKWCALLAGRCFFLIPPSPSALTMRFRMSFWFGREFEVVVGGEKERGSMPGGGSPA